MATTPSTQQARVPAWKRLGLKLAHSADSKKRKIEDVKSEQSSEFESSNGQVKRKKSVTFARDVKNDDGGESENLLNDYIANQDGLADQFTSHEASKYSAKLPGPKIHQNESNEAHAKPTKKSKNKSRDDVTSDEEKPMSEYLLYLIRFGTDRPNWKFKKHNQTLLLKYTFSERRIPSQHFETYLTYIDGLQGQARQRLAERAQAVVDEPHAEEGEFMEDVKSRDDARATAMKQQLLNTKIRLREAQDDRDLDDFAYRAKYTKRRRAEEILKLLADVTAKQKIQTQDDNSTMTTPSNQVTSIRKGPDAAENPGKRRRVRIKKARTGVPEDDLSSVSSVELGPAAARKKTKQQNPAAAATRDAKEESSATSDSSSDESTSDSDESSVETDTDSDSSEASSNE